MTHESAQARSHRPGVPPFQPALTSVLTKDTTNVINSESRRGVSQTAARWENLGRMLELERAMQIIRSETATSTAGVQPLGK